MTSPSGPANGAEPARRQPRIVLEFAGVKSCEVRLLIDNDVDTGQLYAAAWLLEARAREIRMAEAALEAQQQRRGGLFVPPGATVGPRS